MGSVISIEAWRQERQADDPSERLEQAVFELDGVLQGLPPKRLADPLVERELLAITGAVSVGLLDDAADRAERLTDRLMQLARKGG
jgi:hypothetical protein